MSNEGLEASSPFPEGGLYQQSFERVQSLNEAFLGNLVTQCETDPAALTEIGGSPESRELAEALNDTCFVILEDDISNREKAAFLTYLFLNTEAYRVDFLRSAIPEATFRDNPKPHKDIATYLEAHLTDDEAEDLGVAQRLLDVYARNLAKDIQVVTESFVGTLPDEAEDTVSRSTKLGLNLAVTILGFSFKLQFGREDN